jgi:myo-inositol-1(or 4)-monophosphatase
MIKKGYKKKDVGFIGEENLNTAGRFKFIIDPIDGTNNFASGIDYFCVSIGFMQDYKLLVGLIYKPTENLYFFAEKNRGAYVVRNNTKTRLALKPQLLKDCMLTTYLHDDKNIRKKEIVLIKHLFNHVRAIRIYASIALDLCNLAYNRLQVVVSAKYNIWDIAAAKIIIEESGGKFVDWKGKDPIFYLNEPNKIYQLISCHPKILSEVLKFLN